MSNEKIKRKSSYSSVPDDPATFQKLQTIVLLKPKFDNRKSVLKSFQQRKTIREISDIKLPLQTLSNLLWAACGDRKSVV